MLEVWYINACKEQWGSCKNQMKAKNWRDKFGEKHRCDYCQKTYPLSDKWRMVSPDKTLCCPNCLPKVENTATTINL
jgi:hypothetical protein